MLPFCHRICTAVALLLEPLPGFFFRDYEKDPDVDDQHDQQQYRPANRPQWLTVVITKAEHVHTPYDGHCPQRHHDQCLHRCHFLLLRYSLCPERKIPVETV